MPTFFILALPRSRTTWLSHFLSYGPKRCGHDIAIDCDTVADFVHRLADLDGTCETGAVIGWPLIRKFYPGANIIVVKRPIPEVRASLAKFGITPVEGELEARRAMLDECAREPGVSSIDYRDLDDPFVCKAIFESCLGMRLDPGWYARLAKQNIQVDVFDTICRLLARRDKLEQFKADVAKAVRTVRMEQACSA